MSGWLLLLLLACGGGTSVPTPAELPGEFAGLRIPMEHVTVEPGDGALDLKVGGDVTTDDWLATVHAGLTADGWTMNQAMEIPGGRILEYLKTPKSLKIVAGGRPGSLSVHMKIQ